MASIEYLKLNTIKEKGSVSLCKIRKYIVKREM